MYTKHRRRLEIVLGMQCAVKRGLEPLHPVGLRPRKGGRRANANEQAENNECKR